MDHRRNFGAGLVDDRVARAQRMAREHPGRPISRSLRDEGHSKQACYLKDACWFNGVKYEEPLTLDPSAKCNQLMPIYGTVRLAAGGPLSGTTLKCQLKPVTVTDYAVSFTPAELVDCNNHL